MDSIIIENIITETIIGIYDNEQKSPQPIIIDLEMFMNFSNVFSSENLSDTIDYNDVCSKIIEFCIRNNSFLLENLCKKLLLYLFKEFPVDSLSIKIKKPNALENGIPSIQCQRTRKEIDMYNII